MEILMGNEAMALGAIHGGVDIVTGYPGTPSTEVLEYVAEYNKNNEVYVEWSTNEKAAVEVAAGAAYSGKRALVTMKQVGLNASADPVMNLAYIGTKGGLVILVADDPGPISSQTEQDTRVFGNYSNIPVLDPSSSREAYEMMVEAFEISETYECPVIIRPTTRVCHGSESIETNKILEKKNLQGFEKDSRWVIFPKLSYEVHKSFKERNKEIGRYFSKSSFNEKIIRGKKGIISQGISYEYTKEVLSSIESDYSFLKIGTAFPFPEDLVVDFLKEVDEILVIEELSPYIEEEILKLIGKNKLNVDVFGKLTGHISFAGENSPESLKASICNYLDIDYKNEIEDIEVDVPARPPILCGGCPHRGAFFAVKEAMKGRKAVFTGDIGCYTLGNAKPLEMVDTCLCMGAGVTITQGIKRAEDDFINFAFIGDSTFFHSGITGVINAIYNETDMILVVLDNGTTAMTGKQPHPGTGLTMMQQSHSPIKIPELLKGLGIKEVSVLNPFELKNSIEEIKRIADLDGIRAIIFQYPCIKLYKKEKVYRVIEEKCIYCKKCVNNLGCPALIKGENKKISIDSNLCYGCSICQVVCPTGAIVEVENV